MGEPDVVGIEVELAIPDTDDGGEAPVVVFDLLEPGG